MKKLYKKILSGLFLLIITSSSLSAQVSINSNGDLPDNSAMLDVKSTNKGFLPPRVALTAVNSADPVILPATGLLVFNTANTGTPPNNVLPGYYYWNGTLWAPIAAPQGTNPGDMLYWNGLQWLPLSLGSPGQFLQLSQLNIPTWSGPAFAALTTSNVSSITSTTAISGGNISNDGGSAVTARGVCWSTSANPTILDKKTTDGIGTGAFTSSITGLALGITYYVRAYASNSAGTVYGNEISFMTVLAIGDSYQGGIVTYIFQSGDNGYIEGQTRCLIASTTDQSSGAAWGCSGTSIGTSTSIGAGQSNTSDIANRCSTVGIAARICDDLSLNGYNDWFLPSKDELNQMYLHKSTIGGFSSDYYWSSSQSLSTDALLQSFADGSQTFGYKEDFNYSVRAIRSFPSLPTVTTSEISLIAATSATNGGNVTSEGGLPVTARGVCWSTSTNPTIANSYITNGSGTGLFTSNLTGLSPNTLYYIRAYATNSAGISYGNELIFTTLWACGTPFTINHVAGSIAPVTKTVTYNTVTNIPGEPTKCWISQNLGADHQATAFDDATEASAGWYWQFNRKQGYKIDGDRAGTIRTPNTAWISSISENSGWIAENDPCTLELGSGWRIPTSTEWTNVDASGNWLNREDSWNSNLKLHPPGYLPEYDGGRIRYRGLSGGYSSSTQTSVGKRWHLGIDYGNCFMADEMKANGFSLRCIKE